MGHRYQDMGVGIWIFVFYQHGRCWRVKNSIDLLASYINDCW